MKTIKIRFVKRSDDYLIQQKMLFWWRYIRYIESINYAYGANTRLLCSTTKKELLDSFIEMSYKGVSLHIVEYPMLKFL